MSIASKYENIIAELSSLTDQNDTERVSISAVTGYDECVMVGTPSAFLRLAAEIIETIDSCSSEKGRVHNIDGVDAFNTSFGKTIIGSGGVALRSVFLTRNDEDSVVVTNHFRELSQ